MDNKIEDMVGVMAGPSQMAREFDREARKGYAVVAAFLIIGLFAWLIV